MGGHYHGNTIPVTFDVEDTTGEPADYNRPGPHVLNRAGRRKEAALVRRSIKRRG